VRVDVCGVRGSIEAPGAAFAGVGGNTSCLALAVDDGPPTLVLDAGSGIRSVTSLMGGRPFRGVILLTHLHWDHTHGLPFFAAADRVDAVVDLFLPAQGVEATELLARMLSPPQFPIRPDGLRGRWRFAALEEGRSELGGFTVTAREIPHKGGRTFGYRVEADGASLAYLPDHCPTALGGGRDGLGVVHDAALALSRDVDLLVHDAQYTAAELPERARYGHAAAPYAIELAEAAGAKGVLLFHHDPCRTDDAIGAVVAEGRASVRGALDVQPAIEGRSLRLGARVPSPATP
jgi:ribonuclease BN (tRNA processing enzyme)